MDLGGVAVSAFHALEPFCVLAFDLLGPRNFAVVAAAVPVPLTAVMKTRARTKPPSVVSDSRNEGWPRVLSRRGGETRITSTAALIAHCTVDVTKPLVLLLDGPSLLPSVACSSVCVLQDRVGTSRRRVK